MAGNETLRAHCGACAGRMVLITDDPAGFWYVCQACGETTAPRPDAAAAAEDVVWAPAQAKPLAGNIRATFYTQRRSSRD